MKRKILGLTAIVLSLLTLASCSLFGIGSVDYSVEEVSASVPRDSEKWAELEDMLYMLTVNTAVLPEFDSMSESSEACRESLLNYMYGKSYDKYSGNTVLLDKIKEKYPRYNVTCAIPQADYEAEMYRCFGGSVKIVHKSCTLFTYLPAAEVYIPAAVPVTGGVTLTLNTAGETENTYRLTFTAHADEVRREYLAVLIKREDGTLYFDALLEL